MRNKTKGTKNTPTISQHIPVLKYNNSVALESLHFLCRRDTPFLKRANSSRPAPVIMKTIPIKEVSEIIIIVKMEIVIVDESKHIKYKAL